MAMVEIKKIPDLDQIKKTYSEKKPFVITSTSGQQYAFIADTIEPGCIAGYAHKVTAGKYDPTERISAVIKTTEKKGVRQYTMQTGY